MTIECPTCGKTGFSTEGYMKRHHAKSHGESIAQEESVCKNCGDEFCYNPTQREGIWCERECQKAFHRESSVCYRCGGTFDYLPSESEGRFCSHDCRDASDFLSEENMLTGRSKVERVEVECHECGQIQQKRQKYLEKVKRVFCSSECRGAWVSRNPTNVPQCTVEETGQVVDSGWEKDIYKKLYYSELNFSYCEEQFTFESGRCYTPDFTVGNIVVEVKGMITPETIERAELFMEQYPERKYIVVGKEIPANVFVQWESRDELVEIIEVLQ